MARHDPITPADPLGSLFQQLPLALLRASDLNDVLRLIAKFVMDSLDYEDCVIYVRDGDHLVQRAAWGPKSPNGTQILNPLVLRLGEGIVGTAAATQQVQLVHDAGADERYVSDVAGGGSELAVPIIFDHEVLGVIDSEHSEVGFYTDEDAELIRTIAAIAAAQMHNAISTQRLKTTIQELDETRRSLERSTETDSLTGIGNRRHFERHLDDAIASGAEFGICAIDLDGFKAVNDFHGHHEGDRVLRQVADILSETFGQTNAVIARIGGDEFVACAPFMPAYFTSLGIEVVSQIDDRLTDEFGANHGVSASAGIAFGNTDQAWYDADDALFVAKTAGGNQVRVFDPDDIDLVAVRAGRTWSERIRAAMTGDEMRLVGQRIVPAEGSLDGPPTYEVLLRYRERQGKWLTPKNLLDAAARFGLEAEVDSWVLARTLEALQEAPPSMTIALNWSVTSLLSSQMTDHVIAQIEKFRIDPSRLIIEITEHACIDSPEQFAVAVQTLRSAGIRIAIDDLGSGWTSLKTLKDNPVDFIKLDGSWVVNAVHDDVSRIAVKSMIDCAHLLGAEVIAEWVEDESTRSLLAALGADYVQGWLVHRPDPLEDVIASYWAETAKV